MSSRRTVSGTRTPGQLLPERFFVQRYRKSCSAHPSTSNSGSDASSSTPPPPERGAKGAAGTACV